MKYTFLLLATAVCCLLSCKKETKSVYEACCGVEPLNDVVSITLATEINGVTFDTTFLSGIYIPNIFIPDNSGSNDLFIVFGGQGVEKIVSAVYTDEAGQQLFKKENFLPNDTGAAWDGKRSDGSFYKGLFHYDVNILFIDGKSKTYSGDACAVPCQPDGFPADHLPKCAFPNQNSGYGSWDPTIPGETGCF